MDMIYAWIKPQWSIRFIIGLVLMAANDLESPGITQSDFGRIGLLDLPKSQNHIGLIIS